MDPQTVGGAALVVLGVVLAIKVVKTGLKLVFLGLIAAGLYLWFVA